MWNDKEVREQVKGIAEVSADPDRASDSPGI